MVTNMFDDDEDTKAHCSLGDDPEAVGTSTCHPPLVSPLVSPPLL